MSQRSSLKDFTRAARARWNRAWGYGNALMPDDGNIDYAASNDWAEKARTANGANDVEVWRVDSDNNLRIGGQAISPMPMTFSIDFPSLTGTPTQAFFIAPAPMVITGIQCSYATANGATLTATVTKDTGTQAPGAGSVVQVGSFNLNTTTNTVQNATLPTPYVAQSTGTPQSGVIKLATGDRLSLKFSTAVTSLAGLVLTVAAFPGGKGHVAVYHVQANGSLATMAFHLANRPMTVQKVMAVWSAAGTDAGAVTIDITKDTSTNAPGAGTSILSAALSVKTTANTVATPALTATAATKLMAAGDRLSIKYTGTLTALAGMVVVVWFNPIYYRKEASYAFSANGSLASESFFVADRDYVIKDLSEVHSAAGTDGGAVTCAITIDANGVAPGAGTIVQTDNSNAGFNMKGTANTVQVGTLATPRNLVLPAGARLSTKFAGTLTTLAGVVITVSLGDL